MLLEVFGRNPNRIFAVWTQPFSLHCICFSIGQLNEYGQIIRAFWQELAFPSCGWERVCARDRGSKAECVWECQFRTSRWFANWTFFCCSTRSVGSWGRTHPALVLELQQKRRALLPPLALCEINGRVRPRDCLSEREKKSERKWNHTSWASLREEWMAWFLAAYRRSQLDKERLLMGCEW